MCGIIGYIGNKSAMPIVLKGLQQVAYRGYDSAGMATLNTHGKIELQRAEGKLECLAEMIEYEPLQGHIGIGHTRWATHGAANVKNAHPHVCGSVAVVHNGIIENFLDLKKELESEGWRFASDTDTEVVPQLINRNLAHGMNPQEATVKAVKRLRGSFALAIIFADHKDLIIAVRKRSPLLIGIDQTSKFICSSESALPSSIHEYIRLEDGDIATISSEAIEIRDSSGLVVERRPEPVVVIIREVEKGTYPHFMLKEIFEQPSAISGTLKDRINVRQETVSMPDLRFYFGELSRLSLVGCGTAYHVGIIARYWFEELAELATDCDVASEFLHRKSVFFKQQAGIFISQSGETADTIAALNHLRSIGLRSLAIVNVPNSTLSHSANETILTNAGPEIGVASTKAFTAQLALLAMLVVKACYQRNTLAEITRKELLKSLIDLTSDIESVLALSESIADIARELAQSPNVFYVGRGTSYGVALEGALKLKEISYIHAEAFAAGELKHGPLALISNQTPVVIIAPPDQWFSKTASNLREIVARGGKIILVSDKRGCEILKPYTWQSIAMPHIARREHRFTNPILYSVVMQLLAYHAGAHKEIDVDKPRNLAKSVTVE